nr:hypothetical protein [Paenibacillus elgii]
MEADQVVVPDMPVYGFVEGGGQQRHEIIPVGNVGAVFHSSVKPTDEIRITDLRSSERVDYGLLEGRMIDEVERTERN